MGSRYGSASTSGGLGTRARNVAEGAQSYLSQGYENVEDMVVNHPASSALVVFGLGLGLGVLIGTAIASEQRSRWTASRRIDTRQAERLGRRVLDSISDYLPSAIADRIS